MNNGFPPFRERLAVPGSGRARVQGAVPGERGSRIAQDGPGGLSPYASGTTPPPPDNVIQRGLIGGGLRSLPLLPTTFAQPTQHPFLTPRLQIRPLCPLHIHLGGPQPVRRRGLLRPRPLIVGAPGVPGLDVHGRPAPLPRLGE